MTDTPDARRVPWLTVVAPREAATAARSGPLTPRRVVIWVAVASVLVIAAVLIAALVAARGLAEQESVQDAADRADRIAEAFVQPALTDALLSGDRAATEAVDVLGEDAIELSAGATNCTSQCQAQNQIRGSLPVPPNPANPTPIG
ncbi:hypothetical protein [Subtercola boreus]|uniref:Uncharacterized protein n=1 Tax=Subtercola boreus TaxID=120213 RepID=A0A3E0WC70_9MICO|nr:hypothetical protein [Subtercola boreus]RFA21183.1 hypothetical protein B7R24_07275 [Subtercola boreus]RFA21566.1 hypothetical protein B7R23_07220 [Subtercola boreus]RFA27536.1 hypothetical protein B7R25_07345 [Subtercola boreus]